MAVGWTAVSSAISPMLRELEDAYIRIGEQVRPCVVNIDAEQTAPEGGGDPGMRSMEEFFRYFNIPMPEGQPPPSRRAPVASGSGFIYDKDGHIITNNHVVEHATTLKVRLATGEVYNGTVVGTDPDTDLAVIKIEATGNLPVADLGDSDNLKVGQFAVALGSPRGLEGSLSFGHVSALGRDDLRLPTNMRFQNFIQTDAAINLGNSGGPLCDIDGRVIGINTAIVFGAESLGFAIPINMAKQIIPQLIQQGKIVRGFLGVQIMNVNEVAERSGSFTVSELVDVLGLPDTKGAYVESASPDSPAEEAGIKNDDVIRKLDGASVADKNELVRRISEMAPGTKVNLEVWRGKKPLEIQVTLAEFKDTTTALFGKDILGLRLQQLSPEIRQRFSIGEDVKGLLVVNVEPESPAAEAEIMTGDIITEVAQQNVETVDEFKKVIDELGKPGESLLLRVARPGEGAVRKLIKIPNQ
jgi:serine protease Do